MLTQGASEYGLLLKFGVLLTVTAVLTLIAARMYGPYGVLIRLDLLAAVPSLRARSCSQGNDTP